MSSICIERHASFDALPIAEWEALRAKQATASIFQSHGWNWSWWTTKGDRNGSLVLLSARKEGRLVGIAPLQLESRDGILERPTLSFVGRGNADYCDFIVDDNVPEATGELLRAATRIPEPWEVVKLDNLPEHGAVNRLLSQGAFRNLEFLETAHCPAVTRVAGERTFVQLTQKKMLRQNTRLLTRAGHVETVHLRDAEHIRPHLGDFFAQHVKRWSTTRFPSLFLDDRNRAFYVSLVDRLSGEEKILFTLVNLDGRPVAYHLGFLERSRLYYYKPTFDPEWGKKSPGSTLLSELFMFCEGHDLKTFDFLRGDESYKSHFANATSRTQSYLLHRHRGGLYTSVAARKLKETARRLLRTS